MWPAFTGFTEETSLPDVAGIKVNQSDFPIAEPSPTEREDEY